MVYGARAPGKIVYQREIANDPYFVPGCVQRPQPGSDRLPPQYTPTGPQDTTLVFESRFESGNLAKAIKVFVLHG